MHFQGTLTCTLRGDVIDTLDIALAHGLDYAQGAALDALLKGDTHLCVAILERGHRAGMTLAESPPDTQVALPFEEEALDDALRTLDDADSRRDGLPLGAEESYAYPTFDDAIDDADDADDDDDDDADDDDADDDDADDDDADARGGSVVDGRGSLYQRIMDRLQGGAP